jgi:ATP-binding cassette subfamily B protein
MLASAERLMEVEMLPKDSVDEESSLWMDFEEIRGEKLTFAYDSDVSAIHYGDFSVKAREFVAVTGPSGCGKSTLMKLMLALYRPQSGCLSLIRGEQKQELRSVHRELFAYVPQGNYLMSGPIWEVVGFAEKTDTIDRKRVEEACKAACAHEFICELPNGYDTVLGERGDGLSEGQMQRLAVARAVYSGCPILLLDEATSALDTATEIKIQKAFDKLSKGRTTLIIAHRLSTIKNADCIAVIGDKEVKEIGTHEELILQNGIYTQLHNVAE